MEKIMMTEAVKITQKGQVTIPKEIRDRLKTNTVYFEVVNDAVVVRAVKDAAGSLSEYAKNVSSSTPMKQMKETAWGEAVHEKATQKSS
jgi:AbrB family looped-hinge helix DNA binding protein